MYPNKGHQMVSTEEESRHLHEFFSKTLYLKTTLLESDDLIEIKPGQTTIEVVE